MNDRSYLLRIRLLYAEPEIWRRFVVPAGISLDRFHDVIQIVMGWTDSHLHDFTIGKQRYTESPESKEDGCACGKYCLGDLIKQKNRSFGYIYDFGDGWKHELILEDSRYSNPGLRSKIVCLEGARACPPEDVGGVPGYYNFCNVLKDPEHGDYEALMAWSGGNYDSEKFDTDTVNFELAKYMRWSRDRYRFWGGIT